MSPVLSRPRPQVSGERHRAAIIAAAVGVAVVIVLGLLLTRAGSNHFVTDLRVENPTAYDLDVEVADPGGAWTEAGTARRQATTALLQVGDQGKTWVFRFSYADTNAAEMTVPRATLEADGWHVTVPEAAGAKLSTAGIGPPP